MSTEKGLVRRVKLWNRGENTFDYEVLGTRYTIEPGKYVEMPRRTAVAVKGFYPGKNVIVRLEAEPVYDSGFDENVEVATNKEKVVSYACYKCDAEFDSKEKLADHMKEKHTTGRKVVKKEETVTTEA